LAWLLPSNGRIWISEPFRQFMVVRIYGKQVKEITRDSEMHKIQIIVSNYAVISVEEFW